MDLLGETPAFDLHNPHWPVFGTIYDGPPTRFYGGEVRDTLVGEGSQLEGGRIVRSVIGSGVRIGKGAEIEESIIMDRAEIGAGVKLKGAIVDRFHSVPAGAVIGGGIGTDERRYFRDPSGLGGAGAGRDTPAVMPAERLKQGVSTMEHKALGSTDVMIPEIGLGVWRYSGGVEPLRAGIELGAFLIDTAEIYGTEEVVGRLSRVCATGSCWRPRCRATTSITTMCAARAEASLRRLNTDSLDLYQVTGPTPGCPFRTPCGRWSRWLMTGW